MTSTNWTVLDRLLEVIRERQTADPETSYVARLRAKGRKRIVQKIGEEAVETALAGLVDDRAEIVGESADLLFHLLLLWADASIAPDEVMAELARREGLSGLEEKRQRNR
ncbi:MAG: hypothetical protein Kow00104_17960 [Rhodothalassiaceae bacterium]